MKKLATLACVIAVAGLILTSISPALAGAKAHKSHKVDVTVVSIDVKGKMLTFENMEGETMSAPVLDDKAIEALETLKAGDKVTVTCQDSEEGEHEGITKIKKAMEKKA